MASNTGIEIIPSTVQQEAYSDYSALLLLPIAAVLAHQYTKKQLRKAKHKMLWQLLRLQLKSMFSFKGKKKMSPLLKALLILIGVTAVFGLIFGAAAGGIAFVVALLFLAIYGSEL